MGTQQAASGRAIWLIRKEGRRRVKRQAGAQTEPEGSFTGRSRSYQSATLLDQRRALADKVRDTWDFRPAESQGAAELPSMRIGVARRPADGAAPTSVDTPETAAL